MLMPQPGSGTNLPNGTLRCITCSAVKRRHFEFIDDT
jgi:hypothetical protein